MKDRNARLLAGFKVEIEAWRLQPHQLHTRVPSRPFLFLTSCKAHRTHKHTSQYTYRGRARCLPDKGVRRALISHPHSQALTLPPAGTNPIHNKQKKKAQKEEDEDDKAFKAKQQAGARLA